MTPKKFNTRMPLDLYEAMKVEADAMHVSVNTYTLQAVESYIRFTRSLREKREGTARAPAPSAARSSVLATSSRVGRNEPCPCGSGKKAKQCHPEFC